ncbi:MAG: T9SS type A sorting domain-containing protein [Candidatus Krumholzibacteriota bacterium]|nr:T9SS type A sorting domain-containing protein [Candidatus Krumholzibacteriota bacterium]
MPEGFSVAYNTGSGNQLSWDPSLAPDFQYFNVYRDTDPSFTPDPGNLVDATVSTSWTDPSFNGGGVYYKITAVDDAGNESDPASPGITTAIDGVPVIPKRYALYQNAPNPFNPVTRISYELAEQGHARLVIYNVRGQRVATLVDGVMSSGDHIVTWNAKGVSSGVYFYRLTAGHFSETRRMVLLK